MRSVVPDRQCGSGRSLDTTPAPFSALPAGQGVGINRARSSGTAGVVRTTNTIPS